MCHRLDDDIENYGRKFHELVDEKKISVFGVQKGWKVPANFPVDCINSFSFDLWCFEVVFDVGQNQFFSLSIFNHHMNQIDQKSDYVAADIFGRCGDKKNEKFIEKCRQEIYGTSNVHCVSCLQNLAGFTVRRNRTTSAFSQSFSVRKQIMQVLIRREDCRVQTEIDIENRFLIIDPCDFGT